MKTQEIILYCTRRSICHKDRGCTDGRFWQTIVDLHTHTHFFRHPRAQSFAENQHSRARKLITRHPRVYGTYTGRFRCLFPLSFPAICLSRNHTTTSMHPFAKNKRHFDFGIAELIIYLLPLCRAMLPKIRLIVYLYMRRFYFEVSQTTPIYFFTTMLCWNHIISFNRVE